MAGAPKQTWTQSLLWASLGAAPGFMLASFIRSFGTGLVSTGIVVFEVVMGSLGFAFAHHLIPLAPRFCRAMLIMVGFWAMLVVALALYV